MFFDSHAHLDDEKFTDDRAEVIARAKENGVTHIVNIGADMESSARSIELTQQYDMIYAAVGVHPHDAKKVIVSDYDQLAQWTRLDKVVAIGEIGLDYYYDLSPRELQREVFIRQLDVARQTHMPIVIHDRDAHGETMEILKREGKGLIGVVHCFAGSMEMAAELIKMGWYIGCDGPVTFKNAAKLPEIMQKIPLERLLIETDSPYLTPVPFRGKRNEPAYVRFVAEHIAVLRGIPIEEIAKATTQNVCDLFQIKL
ncbi:TatD family hydrolase [Anaerosinus sp.]|uniref:TatD family hydrolase n=1 Tax=Selenobaculum sp. TaxID=3074374 RepID=UPI0015ACB1D2